MVVGVPASRTVKKKIDVVLPTPVVTVRVRTVPAGASGAIVTRIGNDVAVPPLPIVAVTPVPLNVTAVAPPKLLPKIVAG